MKKVVTFEKVVEACRGLEAEGKQTSVRNIIAITGGSTSTVTPLIREYELHQRREKELQYVMSESLRHALIAEMSRIYCAAKSDIEANLYAALEHEKEILTELAEAKEKNEELTDELQVCRQRTDQADRDAGKRLAALKQKIEDFHQHHQNALDEKQQLQTTVDELRTHLTELKTHFSHNTERLKTIQEEKLALTQKADELKDQAHNQEKRADIAENKCAYADERIAELKADLANEQERRVNARKNSQ